MSDAAANAAGSLDALLARLGGGAEAAHGYEQLRARALALFRVYLPGEAEALADVVLDRLGRRLAEGVVVDDVRLYALGIARLVLREAQARVAQRQRAEHDPTLLPAADADDDAERADVERALRALSRCLDELDTEPRRLILAYYGADGGARIRLRQELAAACATSLNALRNRALRLRARIEDCVRARLQRPPPRDGSARRATSE